MSGPSGSKKAILAAFLANLGIAAAKFIAWLFTGAASMLAEAIHSVADTSNQGLLLLGGYLARRRADSEHPFGYGRERYFWAFVVAMVIFTLGAAFSIYEGVSKLLHPHDVESVGWAVGVLVVAIIFEGASLMTAAKQARPFLAGRGWMRFVRDSKAPELPVVLL
ncbi:MAG: cation diffusion facilitator family transporter, partial [Deltaproteobacteria bacterium]